MPQLPKMPPVTRLARSSTLYVALYPLHSGTGLTVILDLDTSPTPTEMDAGSEQD